MQIPLRSICTGYLRRYALGEVVKPQTLLQNLDPNELICEATALSAWDMGTVDNADDVARFMVYGGPFPPLASAKIRKPIDNRPDEKYWMYVKKEMYAFLCTDDKKYYDLWKQIDALQKKSTTAIVGVMATFLGASIGAPATLIAGFISVCLFAAIKIGKEAFCRYYAKDEV